MHSIRPALPTDHASIRDLIAESFSASEFGHNGESELVVRIKNSGCETLSLVAEIQETVVGHIFFSPITISDETDSICLTGMALAPMAVSTKHQRTGVGTAMVEDALVKLTESGCPLVVVAGHPDYYPKFGFEPAANYGLQHNFDGLPQELFFVKFLSEPAELSKEKLTIAKFHPEFYAMN